ncbi:HAD family hydrolase [uncultured Pseudodesulfovibrio sp.]|uniref:HAD family hydrolase n=1 Tax=uncultured Pseudodesulfovibrio sp. TaxID=2035858 RepID=UPI0029C69A84|nr:HAD family hydrolase [uncultured Pseudodesulfovibrio sp.]
MPQLDAIIFDFDGTLADVPLDFDWMKTKIAALGEVFMDERPVPNSKPALEWLEELACQVMKRDRAEGMEFLSRGRLVIAAMELDAARDGALFDFTRPMLTTLKEHGVAAGVITRNISPAVKTVFPDIEDYTRVFIPREDAPKLKPDPAHLYQALTAIGADPKNSLMVGDHPMDVETGRRAGTLCAAVTSGNSEAEAFADLAPDFICTNVAALLDRLVTARLI